MLTVLINEDKKEPIYVQLYIGIKESIAEGTIKPGEKLPSKRKLAEHLNVSVNTVTNAYAQLMAEGNIEAIEKRGYYVRRTDWIRPIKKSQLKIYPKAKAIINQHEYEYELNTNMVDTANFPFSIWAKLMRESIQEEQNSLLELGPTQGDFLLRQEIANYLHDFRNITVSPEQIVLGAGVEPLLGVIIELLSENIFALENPCYYKLSRILDNKQIKFKPIQMDLEGMRIDILRKSRASVVYTTPSRHFPLGTIMSATRRMQLIEWAEQSPERYLIEDDYDSEYRYRLRQIPALYSTNHCEKIIYLNTFARTLAPSLRIAYMILPMGLLNKYHELFSFSSCTVSTFEQSTLRRFLQQGYYERHINRMRTIYRERRDVFVSALSPILSQFTISGSEAGIHFLIHSNTGMTEKQMIEYAKKEGVKIYGLSDYYIDDLKETHTVLLGFGGLSKEALRQAAARLIKAWKK